MFKRYNLMFDICIHNKNVTIIKLMSIFIRSLLMALCNPSSHSSSLLHRSTFSLQIKLHFLGYCRNGIIQYALFFCLPFTQQKDFQIHSCCIYGYNTICFFLQIFRLFPVFTITNKLAMNIYTALCMCVCFYFSWVNIQK